MSSAKTPVFYKPVFGNDNISGAIDIAAFSAPVAQMRDAAAPAPVKKLFEK